jgi:hypothetical protein
MPTPRWITKKSTELEAGDRVAFYGALLLVHGPVCRNLPRYGRHYGDGDLPCVQALGSVIEGECYLYPWMKDEGVTIQGNDHRTWAVRAVGGVA